MSHGLLYQEMSEVKMSVYDELLVAIDKIKCPINERNSPLFHQLVKKYIESPSTLDDLKVVVKGIQQALGLDFYTGNITNELTQQEIDSIKAIINLKNIENRLYYDLNELIPVLAYSSEQDILNNRSFSLFEGICLADRSILKKLIEIAKKNQSVITLVGSSSKEIAEGDESSLSYSVDSTDDIKNVIQAIKEINIPTNPNEAEKLDKLVEKLLETIQKDQEESDYFDTCGRLIQSILPGLSFKLNEVDIKKLKSVLVKKSAEIKLRYVPNLSAVISNTNPEKFNKETRKKHSVSLPHREKLSPHDKADLILQAQMIMNNQLIELIHATVCPLSAAASLHLQELVERYIQIQINEDILKSEKIQRLKLTLKCFIFDYLENVDVNVVDKLTDADIYRVFDAIVLKHIENQLFSSDDLVSFFADKQRDNDLLSTMLTKTERESFAKSDPKRIKQLIDIASGLKINNNLRDKITYHCKRVDSPPIHSEVYSFLSSKGLFDDDITGGESPLSSKVTTNSSHSSESDLKLSNHDNSSDSSSKLDESQNKLTVSMMENIPESSKFNINDVEKLLKKLAFSRWKKTIFSGDLGNSVPNEQSQKAYFWKATIGAEQVKSHEKAAETWSFKLPDNYPNKSTFVFTNAVKPSSPEPQTKINLDALQIKKDNTLFSPIVADNRTAPNSPKISMENQYNENSTSISFDRLIDTTSGPWDVEDLSLSVDSSLNLMLLENDIDNRYPNENPIKFRPQNIEKVPLNYSSYLRHQVNSPENEDTFLETPYPLLAHDRLIYNQPSVQTRPRSLSEPISILAQEPRYLLNRAISYTEKDNALSQASTVKQQLFSQHAHISLSNSQLDEVSSLAREDSSSSTDSNDFFPANQLNDGLMTQLNDYIDEIHHQTSATTDAINPTIEDYLIAKHAELKRAEETYNQQTLPRFFSENTRLAKQRLDKARIDVIRAQGVRNTCNQFLNSANQYKRELEQKPEMERMLVNSFNNDRDLFFSMRDKLSNQPPAAGEPYFEYANLIMDIGSSYLDFKPYIVEKGQKPPVLEENNPTTRAVFNEDAQKLLAISANFEAEEYGVVKKGEKGVTIAVKTEIEPTKTIRVSGLTKAERKHPNLTVKDQEQEAIAVAHSMLYNLTLHYKSMPTDRYGKKIPICIKGEDPKQAERICAALLLIGSSNQFRLFNQGFALNRTNIVSHVSGYEVPNYYMTMTTDAWLIDTHLKSITKGQKSQLRANFVGHQADLEQHDALLPTTTAPILEDINPHQLQHGEIIGRPTRMK